MIDEPMTHEPAQRAAHPPAPPLDVRVRRAMVWIAVAVLAGAVVTVFVSVLQVIEIWFDYQYVPIARGILALLVAAVALYVVRLLTLRPTRANE